MKKKVFGRKLSRSRPAREALFAGLARALVLNGKIVTTRAKAKAFQGDIERYVSLAKRADIRSRRAVLSALDNARDVTNILFQKVATTFANRSSGFTRIVLLPQRKGDNAKMVRMEWTEAVNLEEVKPEKKGVKKAEKVVKKKTKNS